MTPEDLAQEIVSELVKDIKDRSGFGLVWSNLTVSAKKEMYDVWRSKVQKLLTDKAE